MAINLFLQILKFPKYGIKLIEKLSRRHLIHSSDVFVIKGCTVSKTWNLSPKPRIYHKNQEVSHLNLGVYYLNHEF